jgi:hypothetical protein
LVRVIAAIVKGCPDGSERREAISEVMRDLSVCFADASARGPTFIVNSARPHLRTGYRRKVIDEFFLTLAPHIAGRQTIAQRPSIAGETLFLPETAPWFELRRVKRAFDPVQAASAP